MFDIHDAEAEAINRSDDNAGMFLSIGDLMSGLLMIFALLFIVVQLQIQKIEAERQRLEAELQQKIEELRRFQEAFDRLPLVIKAEIEQAIGTDAVKVDPKTGDISIGDQILFDEGSDVLREEGKAFLRQFIPLYSQIIFSDPAFENQVAYVVVEGHTSSAGDDAYNRSLSLRRALAVSNYIFSDAMTFPTRERFQDKLLSAGRGEVDARQDIDNPADRKVLFRFQFRREDFSELLEQGAELERRVDQQTEGNAL